MEEIFNLLLDDIFIEKTESAVQKLKNDRDQSYDYSSYKSV
jgi:hypothetical protein